MADQGLDAIANSTHFDDPQTPLLLSLPGELRNRIWRLLVVREEPILAFAAAGSLQHRVVVPRLAHTGRSIRHEILSIYYSENSFIYEWTGRFNPVKHRMKIQQWLRTVLPYVRDISGETGTRPPAKEDRFVEAAGKRWDDEAVKQVAEKAAEERAANSKAIGERHRAREANSHKQAAQQARRRRVMDAVPPGDERVLQQAIQLLRILDRT
ncbi:hypothetical protein KC343_g10784 [Hortaea werneckii]|nr:hypothetical protein KC323_g884 [Hortaea werneckii]KAI7194974.1 hypothetical protein KC352_g20948 [Hortaea werneckii]KAI7353689.1 hypothetical protein KC320_g3867 [Hortaea werneckii]KAI7558519.1 hypothetical protein KC317_g10955 [Hortaea werneckii]KAI7606121.1 hypothetical protein KC346_g10702 [Hortaea werneckii]